MGEKDDETAKNAGGVSRLVITSVLEAIFVNGGAATKKEIVETIDMPVGKRQVLYALQELRSRNAAAYERDGHTYLWKIENAGELRLDDEFLSQYPSEDEMRNQRRDYLK